MVRRNAFTLIELMVVMAIIILLAGILAPAITPIMEMARQKKCGANLNKLVKDMRTYAINNDQFFPSAFDDDASATVLKVLGSNYVGGASRSLATPTKSGPSRSLYLLARGKFTTLEAFICPSTDNTAKPAAGTADPAVDYDFFSGQQISYSYQSNKNNGSNRYWPVSMTSDATLIVLADRSPIAGTAGDDPSSWNDSASPPYTTWTPAANGGAAHGGLDKFDKNSYNHGLNSQTGYGEGQNVADPAGGVRWTTTPNCGGKMWTDATGPVGDNIWRWGDGTSVPPADPPATFVEASPTSSGDSFLR